MSACRPCVVMLALLAAAACSSNNKGSGAKSGACLSDKDCRDQGKLCNPATAACVQCLIPADCGMSADCVAGSCVAFESCKSSLECKTDQVCDITRSRCVQCLTSADCGGDGGTSSCVDNVCRTTCASDKDCVARHQLCDFSTGTCTDCVRTADCPTGKYCNAGTCSDQVCTPGGTSCSASMLFTCSDDGTAWQSPTACPMECRMTGDGGVCSDRSDAGSDGPASATDTSDNTPDASPPPPDVPIANGPCGDVIDDMEDGDGYICRGNGRIGQWYTAGPTSVMPDQTMHPIPPAAGGNSSSYAMHLSAPMYYGYGSILGVDLAYDGVSVYGRYDASEYQGITFWARGTFPDISSQLSYVDLWVACIATTPTEYGGTCPYAGSCTDNYARAYVGADWSQIMVPFSALGGGYSPFNRAELTHLQFRIVGSPSTPVDLWVDDVAFYR